ncbi:hypothetical protein K469DRAFT_697836 [Zopfia rhizophila CBS 207.26]|uniref:Uncharacterized protein n=1 Tax=Zopfia rhizophila CBS 207.26 TaxID=1314779 RepID=A0A6A6EGD9_9PEZI|nr:hypothetical protein K469DRAFT_697836 [Zopfia rhizophila CBS 207.26]
MKEIANRSSDFSADSDRPEQYTRHKQESTTTSEELAFNQHRLSPMFDISYTKPKRPSAKPADKFHGTKVQRDIDPADGKTKGCNRDLTFDDFVPQRHLGEAKPQKRMGHTWDVVRAIMKLKKPLKKVARKPSVRSAEKQEKLGKTQVARERLLR